MEKAPAKKRKRKNGGARPGAGRPPTNNEYLWARISRDTRVKLDRFARQSGIKQGMRVAFWDKVFQGLLGKVDLAEPEYLTLARSITVRSV